MPPPRESCVITYRVNILFSKHSSELYHLPGITLFQPRQCVNHFFKSMSSFNSSHGMIPHLSTVATSEQNEDSSWCDGGAQLPFVLAERLLPMALQFTGNIFCGVVAGLHKEVKYGF